MIRVIAVDLDDTLLDTTGLLIPVAARSACQAMLDRGLRCTLDQCLEWRAELAPANSHRDLFGEIARRGDCPAAAEAGVHTFYHVNVPAELPLMPGARETLTGFKKRYHLALVTSGARETQWAKIRALGLEEIFDSIFVVDKLRNEDKGTAFRQLLNRVGAPPLAMLSIGNRLSEEIRQAKLLGALTCHFAYGEHTGEVPEQAADYPDFVVDRWDEVAGTCLL